MRLNTCFVFAAVLFSISTPSYALSRGDCGTPEEMTAKLRAEDQHSFGTADRIVRENNLNSLYGMIFTISGDKSVGYVIQSDKPSDERAGKICVNERLADLRLFDAGKPGIPKAALLKASDADAKTQCDRLLAQKKVKPGTCGSLNETLQKGEPLRERVMFQGFNVSKQKDGSYAKDGTLTTVTATLAGSLTDDTKEPLTMPLRGGIYFSSLPEGATTISVFLAYPEYTPYGSALIGKK